ncbi:hypothetical protein EDF62_0804 [Leucobacter luti]|uniref:Uncharacterized protein n=1 Tax=Leucobacter luti TaxID=340320 RepID=A0A4R6S3T9_9MICO|nr:hypothetical protein EDF62_0804 [Leucobacter luti]
MLLTELSERAVVLDSRTGATGALQAREIIELAARSFRGAR